MNALALKTFTLYVSSVQCKKQSPSIIFNVFEYIVYFLCISLCIFICNSILYEYGDVVFKRTYMHYK